MSFSRNSGRGRMRRRRGSSRPRRGIARRGGYRGRRRAVGRLRIGYRM